ncbi:MAG: hypothetical protein KAJ11_08220, partial [Alphaproteobacteria bacterium]|nr:hypothetical protein [Alphaproteobacteria bacterium]
LHISNQPDSPFAQHNSRRGRYPARPISFGQESSGFGAPAPLARKIHACITIIWYEWMACGGYP